MRNLRRFTALLVALLVLATACGSSADTSSEGAGVRLIDATTAADVQADPPPELVILDVRTLEEFSEGHLEGATMIDFYREDFAEQLEGLDRDVPYLVYCRSGNRSGQTAELMAELGFTDVADVDGGILAWNDLDLPTVTP